MPSTRQRKVQELLVQEISDIIRKEVRDPRVGFVTITDAEITSDLRHAKVFFSVLGSEEQKADTTTALNRAAGFVRAEFARRAQMRFVPDIRFQFDTSVERGARIGQLLEQVRQNEREAAAASEAGGGTDTEVA
jgi:ribosome-binding factor A